MLGQALITGLVAFFMLFAVMGIVILLVKWLYLIQVLEQKRQKKGSASRTSSSNRS